MKQNILASILKTTYVASFVFVGITVNAQNKANVKLDYALKDGTKSDWLVDPVAKKATIYTEGKNIILDNGLVKRVFRLQPNVACIDYLNLSNGQQLLRAVKPEAKITINGKEYNIGGLHGQKELAYLLPEWVDKMEAGKEDFVMVNHSISDIKPFINWKRNTWAMNKKQATGKQLIFEYASSLPSLKGIVVKVNYELYDGMPLIVKWVSVENKNSTAFKLDMVVNEVLGLVEEESAVVGSPEQMKKQHGIYIETNYAFNNAMRYDISDQTTHWKIDRDYRSQVNYNYETPCLLEIYPEKAPGIELQPGEIFTSVRTHELLMDSYDRQRRGMMIRKMYSTIAPWTTQNPIFMHLVSRNDDEVRRAVDQCAATGYEAVILSFGSHLNMEDSSGKNIARWKDLADYAHSKGIQIGGYSLFSSRRISDEHDVIDPKTGKPGGAFFGHAPCFGSKWGLAYRDKIKYFFAQTGFNIWENDGPYPGDVCASTTHPGHKGLDDSQWRQINIQKELYHWLNERGVYINAPDWYFLDGTHKIAIGYREVNFSLSREQQRILNRQNIHDGTIEKTASMSWGFVPLTKYQGGGPEAVLEPLNEHLKDYEQLMVQYYGAGVQACYRGPRLYDTDATRQLVANTISWYKKYREILNSDMIQLRRADGRDWDGLIHVNPQLKQKGFVMLYNPLKEKITRTIKLPLYYTGLTTVATLKDKNGSLRKYNLDRNHEIELTFAIEPENYTWYIVE
ncbi:alpha-galactosidase [Chitinophagaceae bacterium LB-8]|uniref:Alpha-galactosidase n=1 Tax=Paraflavisolibacter caeni TaxID=2982496 RepID=A0A9X3BFG4_9BACT|nr:alpha-galactosidase [Paraflavisolibacter caeni]MCU7548799.1 alpha-galactosidase [Paraflavisolibacter caeni]